MNYQFLKYFGLQALALSCIVMLYYFTLSVGNHSMLGSRSDTEAKEKASLIQKVDEVPRMQEALSSFSRLKKSWDSQRKFADSQLEMLKSLNEQGQNQKYITWPSKYMTIKASADEAEAQERQKLDAIRQEEIERINTDQAISQASVFGSFIDQHPSILLCSLALIFSAIYYLPAFNRWNRLGVACLSLLCELVAVLAFGVDFYSSYMQNKYMVYSCTVASGIGICAAYGLLWRSFHFFAQKRGFFVWSAPEVNQTANSPIAEPKPETPKQLEAPVAKLASLSLLAEPSLASTLLKVYKTHLPQKEVTMRFGIDKSRVSRAIDRIEKLAAKYQAQGEQKIDAEFHAVKEISEKLV